MRNAECGIRNAELALRYRGEGNAECRMQNAELALRYRGEGNAECGMRNWRCAIEGKEMRNSECGIGAALQRGKEMQNEERGYMKRILCIILAVGMIFAMSGCGCEDNDGLEEITVVLDWTPNTNHSGLYAALDLGYYEELGLKVNIIQPPEDGAAALVATGKAEFGISFQDSMAPILSGEEEVDIVGVAALVQHNLSGIISQKGKGVDSFKNMEGMRYATWGSPIEQTILKYCMEKAGGDFTKLQMQNTTVTDVFTAFETDMIDCVWVYEYWDVVNAKVKGYDYNYIDFKSVSETMDYYTPVLISSNKYLNENEETAKKFIQATKKGYEYCSENPKEASEILLKAAGELDKELVVESSKFMADKYVDEEGNWGNIDGERWDRFYRWLYEENLVEKDITGKGYTTKFLG